MPLPRVPKIRRTRLDAGPPREVAYGTPDPFGLGPREPWLRVAEQRVPDPAILQRLDGERWVDVAQGVWRIHAWRSESAAIVSQDQQRLFEFRRDGSQATLWEGPALREIQGGALWGDNWMFAAAVLPDGRCLLIHPTGDIDNPETAARYLVLLDSAGAELHRLELPERTDSAVKRGASRRFAARAIHLGCEGRVACLSDTDVLAVGIYDSELAWIGKTTTDGATYGDGRDILVSTSLANRNFHWSRLEGLDELRRRGA